MRARTRIYWCEWPVRAFNLIRGPSLVKSNHLLKGVSLVICHSQSAAAMCYADWPIALFYFAFSEGGRCAAPNTGDTLKGKGIKFLPQRQAAAESTQKSQARAARRLLLMPRRSKANGRVWTFWEVHGISKHLSQEHEISRRAFILGTHTTERCIYIMLRADLITNIIIFFLCILIIKLCAISASGISSPSGGCAAQTAANSLWVKMEFLRSEHTSRCCRSN